MEDKYKTLEDLVRIQYANVFWTHKIQEKQAEIYGCYHKVFSVANIILASLTSAGIISIVLTDAYWLKLVSAFISFFVTVISTVLATFDYKNLAKANKATATKLVCCRNDLLLLLGKINNKDQSVQELIDSFDQLQKKIHEIYQGAPNTTDRAVAKAGKAINDNKDGVYTDEEIDKLLPEALKRGKTE